MALPTGFSNTPLSFQELIATTLPWSDPARYIYYYDGTDYDDELIDNNFGPYEGVLQFYGGNDRLEIHRGLNTLAIDMGDGNDFVDVDGMTSYYWAPSYIYLGDGNDEAYGTHDANIIVGGAGNDYIDGRGGDDVIYGGAGYDELHSGDSFTFEVIMYGGSENDRLYMDGSYAQGSLYGEQGYDFLYGGNSQDYLYGGTENDHLNGGWGNDFLSGDEGYDKLYGDVGADTFYFSVLDGKMDDIMDFVMTLSTEGYQDHMDYYEYESSISFDKLDVSALLTDFDPLTDDITDFVNITDRGDYHVLKVDPDGGEYSFVNVARIYGYWRGDITDEQQMLDDGILIV